MKQTGYFDKLVAGGIMLMTAFSLCATFTGCGGDDEPDDGGDNRSGTPYKFRVEISAEKPDEFTIMLNTAYYNYVDENGLPRTFWLFEDSEKFPSTFIKEFEIPRNFTKYMLTANLRSIDVLMPYEVEMDGIIFGKLYINNKLLTEFTNKFWWITTISYNEKSKKYVVNTSDGNEFETSKID
jgi:hypothetical protein